MIDSAHITEECQPRVKRLSRHHRHRSVKQQQHQSSRHETQITNVIHTMIRPLSNSPVVHNKSLKHHADRTPFASNMTSHYSHQSFNTRSFNSSSKKPRRSIRRHRRSSSQSNRNTRKRNYSNRVAPQQNNHSIKIVNRPECNDETMSKSSETLTKSSKKSILDNQHHIYTSNAWFDCHGITKDHHHHPDRKKKKKCSKLCIILSSLLGFLVVTAIIIVLTVLLIKPQITRPTNVQLRWNSTGETVAGILGQPGFAANQSFAPFGLAIDYKNTLYIAEYIGNRVQRWLMGASAGTTVAGQANGTTGANLSYLSFPAGILIDSDDNLYIADSGNLRVLFWPKNATSGQLIAGTGSPGNSSSQLYTTFGISRDWSTDTLYVADYGNHRIMRYVSNATSGDVVAGGNGAGTNSTQLYYPTSVWFDAVSNSLLIVNYLGQSVVRWEIGDNSWTLVAGSTNLTTGATATLFNYPIGIVVDPMGNIYIADTLNNRIQFFLAGQSVGTTIAGITSVVGGNSTLLNMPYSLTLDNQLNLYVADTGNYRVQKFLRY